MEFIVTLTFLLSVISISSVSAAPAQRVPSRPKTVQYTTRYDYIDVDAILRSNRLLKNYMECVLERGPCTREGLELRRNLPDALETECAKCSEKQKLNAGKIMAYLLQHKKDYWKELLDKYDPQGTFRKKYDVEDFGFGSDDYEEEGGDTNDNE